MELKLDGGNVTVGGRIMVPKGDQDLGTREYVFCHGKRDSADVIKVKDLQIGRLFWVIWVGSI